MPVTSGDSIYYTSGPQPESSENESATQASSIQAALDNRQGHTYVWANDSARNSQTGMRQGDDGYQLDTKTQWEYDNGSWRLALPYAEFTQSSMSVSANTYTAWNGVTINSAASTATDMAVATTGGFILTNPGIYSLLIQGGSSGWAANNSNFLNMTLDSAHTSSLVIGMAGAGVAQAAMPFYRATAANTKIYCWVNSATALSGFTGIVKVGRVG